MTITQFGRVELDIKAVPAPAGSQSRESIDFEQSLEQARRSHDTDSLAQEPQRVDSRNPSLQSSEQESSAKPEAKVGNAAGESHSHAVENVGNPVSNQASADSLNQTHIQEEGPAWRKPTGKGTGPSSASTSPVPSTPSALGQTGGNTQAARHASEPASILQPASARAENAGSQAPSSPSPQARVGSEGIQEVRALVRTSRTAAAGYRSFSAQALQLAEQARDSVFKQIAMKITPEGGKLLLLLDPPELGQLDIRMIVAKGNVMRMSIGAERPEVAMMLERHMPELKNILGLQGLTVADAEVHTHDFRGHEALKNGTPNQGNTGSQVHSEFLEELIPMEPAQLRQAGYITADGLDYWV